MRLLGVERASVFLVDHHEGVLRASQGGGKVVSVPMGRGIVSAVALSGVAEVINDAHKPSPALSGLL